MFLTLKEVTEKLHNFFFSTFIISAIKLTMVSWQDMSHARGREETFAKHGWKNLRGIDHWGYLDVCGGTV
jgi:hypothetical protein